jgi:hypothetical protein
MNTDPMEILLARLYGSLDEVEQFLQEPGTYARHCGLTDEQVAAVLEIDAASLRFAANSFDRKRKSR